MKTLKIALVNFWDSFDRVESQFYKILSRHFHVVFTDENPDFCFCSLFGDISRILKYRCPRILFTGEPVIPDFTLFDYAVGFDFLTLEDCNGENRFFRFPIAFTEWHTKLAAELDCPLSLPRARSLLEKKTGFCCFVSGHESEHGERSRYLSALNEYKRVDSMGGFLNNMPNGERVYLHPSKIEEISKYKFSLVIESTQYPGFVTEKLLDALAAHTVPIYLGDPFVARTFNSRAFVNLKDFPSFEMALERIAEIDRDDDLYLSIITEPAYPEKDYFAFLLKNYADFLLRIVNRLPAEAIRRPTYGTVTEMEKRLTHKWPVRLWPHTIIYRKLALCWWHVRHYITIKKKK